jgi:hypothetical protein
MCRACQFSRRVELEVMEEPPPRVKLLRDAGQQLARSPEECHKGTSRRTCTSPWNTKGDVTSAWESGMYPRMLARDRQLARIYFGG